MSRRKFGTANIITFVPIPAYTRIKHTNICAGREKNTSKSIRTRTKIAQFACYKCKRTDESTQLNGRNERRGKTVRRAVQHANTRSNNKNIREKKTARRGVERYVTFVNFFFIVTCKNKRLTDSQLLQIYETRSRDPNDTQSVSFHFIFALLLLTHSVGVYNFFYFFIRGLARLMFNFQVYTTFRIFLSQFWFSLFTTSTNHTHMKNSKAKFREYHSTENIIKMIWQLNGWWH